jgi:hypothetical protein
LFDADLQQGWIRVWLTAQGSTARAKPLWTKRKAAKANAPPHDPKNGEFLKQQLLQSNIIITFQMKIPRNQLIHISAGRETILNILRDGANPEFNDTFHSAAGMRRPDRPALLQGAN